MSLENKLRTILNEKETKIIPENIKAGVNILGVDGNLQIPDIKVFTTYQDMLADETATVGDIAAVINGGIFEGLYVYNDQPFESETDLITFTDDNYVVSEYVDETYNQRWKVEINTNYYSETTYNEKAILKGVNYLLNHIGELEGIEGEVQIKSSFNCINVTILNGIPTILISPMTSQETGYRILEDGTEEEYTYTEYNLGTVSNATTIDLKLDTTKMYASNGNIIAYTILDDGMLTNRMEYPGVDSFVNIAHEITCYSYGVSLNLRNKVMLHPHLMVYKTFVDGTSAYTHDVGINATLLNTANQSLYNKIPSGYQCIEQPSSNYVGITTAEEKDVLSDKIFIGNDGEVHQGSVVELEPEYEFSHNANLSYLPKTTTLALGATVEEDSLIRAGEHIYINAKRSEVANLIELTADQIMVGNKILGVTGTATSDATATAETILEGSTAYVNGELITGTAKSNTMQWGILNGTITIPANVTTLSIYYEKRSEGAGVIATHNIPITTLTTEQTVDYEIPIPINTTLTVYTAADLCTTTKNIVDVSEPGEVYTLNWTKVLA